MRILRAKYLFDNEELRQDAAIVVKNNTVIDMDKTNIIKKSYNNIAVEELGEGVLFAGFVNLHTHLELSYLKNRLPKKKGFVEWLKAIMKLKQIETDKTTILKGMNEAIKELMDSGVRIVGDISNTLISCQYLKQYMPKSVIFYENYALNKERARIKKEELEKNIKHIKALCKPITISPTAHSIYSTHSCLIEYLSNLDKNLPYSMHFLESRYEKAFLKSEGELYDMLDSFKLIDEQLNYKSIFDYLSGINALRKNMIFVHAVDTDDSDLKTIKNLNGTVCLCPRSNYYISGNLPNIDKIQEYSINIGIGTDSLSSNWDLNLINELKFIHKHYPSINPKTIFKWVTAGGAKALNIKLGIEKNSTFYAVFFKTSSKCPLEEILN